MKRFRLSDLPPVPGDAAPDGQALAGVLPGRTLYVGGLSFHPPGTVTHDEHRPHVEVDHELFAILQGVGRIEVDGRFEPFAAGDLLLVEPGEDHHLWCEGDVPVVNLWLHARD